MTFICQKILDKNPASVHAKEVDVMLSLGRKNNPQSESIMQNKTRVVAFFWNYLFDDSALSYLDK